jgi:hypothetical protein
MFRTQVLLLRRALLEAAEKLHAVAAVREVETKAAAAAVARPDAESATWLLDAAIRRAGTACTPQVGLVHAPDAAVAQCLRSASSCCSGVAWGAPASRRQWSSVQLHVGGATHARVPFHPPAVMCSLRHAAGLPVHSKASE